MQTYLMEFKAEFSTKIKMSIHCSILSSVYGLLFPMINEACFFFLFVAISWHPVHESLFVSGGSDGSMMFWVVG